MKGFSRRLKALLDYTGLRRLRSDKALALRLQEVDGVCKDCRVPAGSECYYCWDERRRGEEKLTQKDVDEKCKDKTYNDKHIERRRERIKGRKVASRADVANQIESKKGAYRNNFDEGHFYFLEDFLALNFSGKAFTSLKAKVKAVNSLKHEVRRTPDGQLGVNVSTLPAMAAYKYQSGESETFAKVTVDKLSDAEEAEEFLDQAIRDSDIISHPLAKVGVDDEADDDDASSDLQQQHQQAEHPDDATTASDSDDGIVGSGSVSVATFKSEQTFALNRSLGPGIKRKHRSPCPSPSRSARNSSRPRSSGPTS